MRPDSPLRGAVVDCAISLQPLDSGPTLKEHVYKALREAILDADIYSAGADWRLDERAMAQRLGISRTPLRDALTRLEHEGLVKVLARKGVFLRRRSRTEIVEMITVWAALESMAARLACENASNSGIDGLRALGAVCAPGSAKIRLSEYSEANIEFHRTIMNLSGCDALIKAADRLFTHLRPVRRRAMRDASRTGRSVEDHIAIVEAITARDADRAGELVRGHTMRLGDYISRTWQHLDELEGG